MLKPPLFEWWTYRRLSPRCFSSSKRLCPKFGRKKCLDFIHYILEFIGDISPTQWIVRYDGGIWWNMDILYLSHVYMIIYIYSHCCDNWDSNNTTTLWLKSEAVETSFHGICNPFTWYLSLKMVWCIMMYPQFMAIWMVYKPTFKVGYIDIYHQPNSPTDHPLN